MVGNVPFAARFEPVTVAAGDAVWRTTNHGG
jgi:hypothetical protein